MCRLFGLRSLTVLSALLGFAAGAGAASGEEPAPSVRPAEALARLQEGNRRFVAGEAEHPHQSPDRREELAGGQRPFAVVLGCADSRTAPEFVFDQGLGDLFVVRVAGNIVEDGGLASIEYALEHLGARLIVVLGHESCGAVKAARDTVAAGGEAPEHLKTLIEAIEPAVKETQSQDVDATVRANVQHVVRALSHAEPVLEEMIRAGDVAVVGARYDLDTGEVEFLPADE
jgi:carbonic anhydrase